MSLEREFCHEVLIRQICIDNYFYAFCVGTNGMSFDTLPMPESRFLAECIMAGGEINYTN